MKRENVFVGNIKNCISFELYKHCADKNGFIPYFKINSMTVGESCLTTYIKQAILIKVSENKYIWLDTVNTFIDELKCDLGFGLKMLNTYPTEENLTFVDEASLKPYFKNNFSNESKNIRVKTLKKEVSHRKHHQGHMTIIK